MLSTLTQRAALLASTLTPDGGGGFAQSWEAFASVWIALEPLGAADAVGADHLQSRVRHRITLRRRPDLAAGQRVAVGARLFRVHAVLDDGPRAAAITLLAEELPGDPS
ncbi:MAG TPA: phage head closure protein [Rhizomicrobium sp.]